MIVDEIIRPHASQVVLCNQSPIAN